MDNSTEMMDTSSPIIIADIGGYSIKYGYKDSPDSPKIMSNSICKVKSERRRLFIGDQLDDCKDYSGLFYILPFNKGFPINWDIQKQILDHTFRNKLELEGSYEDKVFLYTEPYFNFRQLRETMLEVLYEEYGFGTLAKSVPAFLSMVKHVQQVNSDKCCLVVDSGYSFTHVVPFIGGKIVKGAIRRMDIGGKALTNHLKDIISYRQLHVLDETYVINQCKEDCCYVSSQLYKDLETCREKGNSIARDYVLPDFMTVKRGYIRDENNPNSDLQCIRMNNERFQVPEILFYPSDVGIGQIGISHSIVHAIESCPEEFRYGLYNNIVLIGGNSCLPGYRDRIYRDVRSMADALYDVSVTVPENPITDPWFGGRYLVNNLPSVLDNLCLTKREYDEIGSSNCSERMDLPTYDLNIDDSASESSKS
ncbi:actin-related protein 6 [Tetranychus urticae]|uniref:Actin-related protein 6 n=1 Tax=Tetranychus urticae TaxID=32264 RepID=T1L400_TETUR|nr:actin-related protein 6 [Tetranychus urticae]